MNGFIVFDKPRGVTSFTAARIVSRCFGEKKAGHTGTLDPMATGVLPVALGHATRFIELLPDNDKSYIAAFKLGETTDTLDITGNILTKCDNIPDSAAVIASAESFLGESEQTPPMYSAIKKDGKRLYELARKGLEVEREARKINIYSIDCAPMENGEYELTVQCSKGTYIRSLISDIGAALGCGAVMTSLRRTMSNGFTLDSAVTEDEIKSGGDISRYVISVDSALKAYPGVRVSEAQSNRFANGGALDSARVHGLSDSGLYRVYSPDGDFLGLGEYLSGEEQLKVKRVYVND